MKRFISAIVLAIAAITGDVQGSNNYKQFKNVCANPAGWDALALPAMKGNKSA